MTTKTERKAFDDALAKFRTCETEVATTSKQADEARGRVRKAHDALEAIDSQIDALGRDGNVSPDAMDRSAAEAVKLAGKRAGVQSEATIFERYLSNVELLHEQARVRLAFAEMDCHAQQKAFYGSSVSELIEDFVRENRDRLLRLAQAHYWDSIWGQMPGVPFEHAVQFASNFETIAKIGLGNAFMELARTDPAFASTHSKPQRGDPPGEPVRSTLISTEQRSQLDALPAGIVDEAAIRRAVTFVRPDETQARISAPELVARQKQARRNLDANREQVRYYEDRVRAKPDDDKAQAKLADLRLDHERLTAIVETWEHKQAA